jgi:hypothetical protein
MGNVLVNSGDIANSAFIDNDKKAITYHQIEGYYRAVKILIEEASVRKDSLIYPIIYCTRHFVEILLKYTVEYINDHSFLKEKYFKTHNITDNLKLLDEYVNELLPENPISSNIKSYITDIANLDEGSNGTRFKYNLVWNKDTRRDEVSFKDSIEIDLDILNNMIDEVYALSSISDMLQDKWNKQYNKENTKR